MGEASASSRDPRVSVLVMTYQHAPFLRQALDSVLDQEVDFATEILVSEDCSTDGTREIALEYARRHPARVRLLLSERNLKSNEVVARGIRAARGRYVAVLDGDDYWTGREKLRRQADLLDRHPSCATCFHNVEVRYENGELPPHPFHMARPTRHLSRAIPQEVSGLEDVATGNFLQTCSAMFRRDRLGELPSWYLDFFPITDWPLHVLCAEHGDIRYLNEVWAVYRVHDGAAWSSRLSRSYEIRDVDWLASLYDRIDSHLERRFHAAIAERVSELYASAARRMYRDRRAGDGNVLARRALARSRIGAGTGLRLARAAARANLAALLRPSAVGRPGPRKRAG